MSRYCRIVPWHLGVVLIALAINSLSVATALATPASADLGITVLPFVSVAYGAHRVGYNLSAANYGLDFAQQVAVSAILPSGASVIEVLGQGWACAVVSNVVTCTRATLSGGTAPGIGLLIIAPDVPSPSVLTISAAVTSQTSDPVLANNASSSSIPLLPSVAIPVMSPSLWALLALVLAAVGVVSLIKNG